MEKETYYKVMYRDAKGLIPLCVLTQPPNKELKPLLQMKGFYEIPQIPSLLAEADRLNGDYHIYTGIHPLREHPIKGRGKEKDILGVALFAADVDAKDFIDDPVEKQKANEERAFYQWTDKLLSECKAKALAHINSVCEQFSLPPTAIIDSGHGYYPIFKLDKFVEFENDQHREDLKKLNKVLHEVFSADSTFDFARILRVPGTRNIKPGFPADCKLLEFHPERCFSLDEIKRFDVNASHDNPQPSRGGGVDNFSTSRRKTTTILDDASLIEKAKSAQDGAKFAALWQGDISSHNDNHSEADCALCCILAFWTGGNRNRIDRLFRQSGLYREDKWGAREDYRERTLDAALAQVTVFYEERRPITPRGGWGGSNHPKDNKIRDDKRIPFLKLQARRCQHQGNSRKVILDSLHKLNNQKCEPPISQEEIETILHEILPPLNTISAAELLDMNLPKPRWAVPDFVPEGLTILAGRPKVGKSWLALSFCVAVSLGGYVLSKIRVEKEQCLFIGLEDSYRRLQDRLFQLCEGQKPDGLQILLDLPRLDRGGLDALSDWLEQHPDTRLVVVDTLQRVKPPRGKNADMYAEDYDFTGMLQKFALSRGIALICVHHTRKSEAEYLLDELSGTTGISAGADCILMLKQRLDGHILYRTGRDVEEGEFAVRRDDAVGGWELLGDAKEFALSEQRRAIIEVLREGVAMTPKEIAEALSKHSGAVRKLLSSMLRDGNVTRMKGNKYTLLEKVSNNVNNGNGGNGGNGGNSGNDGNAIASVTSVTVGKNSGNAAQTSHDKGLKDLRYRVTTVTTSVKNSNNVPIISAHSKDSNAPKLNQDLSSDTLSQETPQTIKIVSTVTDENTSGNVTDENFDGNAGNGNKNILTERLNNYLKVCPPNFCSMITDKLKAGKLSLSKATEAARRMANEDADGARELIIDN